MSEVVIYPWVTWSSKDTMHARDLIKGIYNKDPSILNPSLSSYKIILYISIAYKQEITLQVLQLRCCVDFMNESDDCSSGAARSGVNFQMPVNRFLQSFRL